MKKQTKLYNVLFPVWMLMLFPQMWLMVLPGNFLIDSLVLVIAMYILKMAENSFIKYYVTNSINVGSIPLFKRTGGIVKIPIYIYDILFSFKLSRLAGYYCVFFT